MRGDERSSRAPERGAPWPLALVAIVLAIVLVGCAAGASDRSIPKRADRSNAPARSSATPAPAPEVFTGSVEDFYDVPDPLPAGDPGDLIRIQRLDVEANQPRSWRVMYRSVDSLGRDRAVTGTVTVPAGDAPEGGWPVLSSAHGTTGIAARCAPSRIAESAPDFGVEGVATVATDYIGLGPTGEVHTYLNGIDEAHSVIDGVRAARALPGVDVGSTWVAWGHSQGGHAALWANQLAESYAPELDLRGTAALAPASELSKTYGPIDEIVANIVSVMGLYGAAANDPTIDPADYVGTKVAEQASVLETGCLPEITSAFVSIPRDEFYAHPPMDTEPARSLLLASDPGTEAADAALLVVQGTEDIRVHPERTDDLIDRLCDVGQVTEYLVKPGTDHDTVIGASAADVTAWLTARLDGRVPTDSCGDPDRPAAGAG